MGVGATSTTTPKSTMPKTTMPTSREVDMQIRFGIRLKIATEEYLQTSPSYTQRAAKDRPTNTIKLMVRVANAIQRRACKC